MNFSLHAYLGNDLQKKTEMAKNMPVIVIVSGVRGHPLFSHLMIILHISQPYFLDKLSFLFVSDDINLCVKVSLQKLGQPYREREMSSA